MPRIVIDIPQSLYQEFMDNANEIRENGCVFDRAIINGTPLDDIMSEIREQKFKGYINESGRTDLADHQAYFNSGLICALEIIDRHTGRERVNELQGDKERL